ncbi:hypothetical protein ACHAPT_008447, partial [Fusarium lateritium]
MSKSRQVMEDALEDANPGPDKRESLIKTMKKKAVYIYKKICGVVATATEDDFACVFTLNHAEGELAGVTL